MELLYEGIKVSTHRTLSYSHNLLMVYSHLISALIGARYDLPFSAQCGAWYMDGKIRGKIFKPIVDLIFYRDPDHCLRSWHVNRQVIAFKEKLKQSE